MLTINGDIQRISDIEKMIRQTVDHYSKLDVLVNNAAIVHISEITETTEEDIDRVVNTNLRAFIFPVNMLHST